MVRIGTSDRSSDDRDRSVFLDKLRISIGIYEVRVHADVLVSNHFHLIVDTRAGGLIRNSVTAPADLQP